MVCAQGVASSFSSIIIYMLYIHEIAISMDRNLSALMTSSVVPFLISRIWILVSRGEVDQDPVLFAVKDKMSYLLGGLTGLLSISLLIFETSGQISAFDTESEVFHDS